MATEDVDAYFAGVEEPKRSTLEEMRKRILAVIPAAEQTISYGMPAFKMNGKTIAGLAAFKNHLSYLPHSGSTLTTVAGDVADYEQTKGSLHFAVDAPLPQGVVRALVEARLREVGLTAEGR